LILDLPEEEVYQDKNKVTQSSKEMINTSNAIGYFNQVLFRKHLFILTFILP
jgi:hypothetical protein